MGMRTVTINGVDICKKFGMALSQVDIATPEPVRKTVDVVGRDGVVDMSSYYGAMRYKNRQIKIKLMSLAKSKQVASEFLAELHGKKVSLVFSDDSEYEYIGFCKVSKTESRKGLSTYMLELEVKPYKYELKVVTYTLKEGAEPTEVRNGDQAIVPVITCKAMATVTNLTTKQSQVLPAGTHKVHAIQLAQGVNHMQVMGTAKLQFKRGYL